METSGLTYCIKYQTWFSAEAHDPFCACMPLKADWAKAERDTYRRFMNFITCDPGYPGEEKNVSEARRNLEVKMAKRLLDEQSMRLQMLTDEGWNQDGGRGDKVSISLGTEETLGLVLGIQSRAKRLVTITEEWAEGLSEEIQENAEQELERRRRSVADSFPIGSDEEKGEGIGLGTSGKKFKIPFTSPTEQDLNAVGDLILSSNTQISDMRHRVHLRTEKQKAALVETLQSALELLKA